ncbi:MAG: DUF1007 family protein [Nitrospinota bacterium]|nr:DUF1007 family protein [Nitrospinota bacterium]
MTKKIIIRLTILLTFLVPLCEHALAHPHVFIEQKIEIIFGKQGIEGFNINWQFDEMFTSMIIGDYDKNSNGILEENEVIQIEKEAFSNLSDFSYFTFIKIDGKVFKIKSIKNFSVSLNNNKLVYNFFIPCSVTATNDFQHIIIDSYDPSYYSTIIFDNNRLASLNNSKAFEVKINVKEDKSTSIYYGQVNPWGMFMVFRIKQ